MIVVDVEATGTDSVKHSLLSVAAVEFEKPERQFYEECRIFDGAHIDKEALEVNGFREDEITDSRKKTDGEVVENFLLWAKEAEDRTIAGQNPCFDHDFLRQTAKRYHLDWPMAYRLIDLHSIAWFHLVRRGIAPPLKNNHSDLGLDEILRYLGLPTRTAFHNALEDAKLEAEAFSRLINEKPLFEEYSKFPLRRLEEER